MSKQAGKKPRFRFGLVTMLMLLTTSVLLVEKPVRVLKGKRMLAEAATKDLSPSELEWKEVRPPWFGSMIPISWQNECDTKEIATIRLYHVAAGAVPASAVNSDSYKRLLQRIENEKKLVELLQKYPDATEQVVSIELAHEVTSRLEDWIATRSRLKTLRVSNRGKPLRPEFLLRLTELRQLEVLSLGTVGREQVEILKTMKSLRWLRLGKLDASLLTSLRESLPNTYVD